ncbi:MAG: DNA polymerase III subunit delta' [Candidatus Hydrogenedentes bacterium]|nr:DNA polymerase III subunit delta' [Candidatus Hydrogenedentota bacterium]
MNTTREKNKIPKAFEGIYDQDVAVKILSNSIKRNRITHAYLFWGPEGVGKKLTAKAFAKSVLCSNREEMGCNNCSNCSRIEKECHPDLIIIKPTGKTRLISVENIEEINALAQFRPYEGNRRFVVFEEAERIGIPAQNHFLKTLEEPPSNTTFILITPNPGLILQTVRSRCQPVRFNRLHPNTIKSLLIKIASLGIEEARTISNISQGQISRSLEMLKSNKIEIILDIFTQLADKKDPLILTTQFEEFIDALRKKIEKEFTLTAEEKKQLSSEEIDQLEEIITAEIEAKVSHEFESCLFLINCILRDILLYHYTKDNSMLYYPQIISIYQYWQPEKVFYALEFLEKLRVYIARNISREKIIRDLFFTLSPHY